MASKDSGMNSVKLNNNNIRSQFMKDLISSNPSKYFSHSQSDRLKKSNFVSSDDFISDARNIISNAGIDINDIQMIPPGRSGSEGRAKSDQFETAWISIEGFKEFPIVITSMQGRGKTSNIFKEGMVCFFAQSEREYSPIIKKSAKTPEEYFEIVENIMADIEENDIPFMENKDQNEILQFIKSKADSYDLDFINSVQNSMSIGNWIRNSEFSDWEIRIDGILKKVKREASKILKVPADKWNPMDIIIIRPGSSNEIMNKISEAARKNTKAGKLDAINNIFCEDLDDIGDECLAIAISLKEEAAQHGKAKSYLDALEASSIEYNLTKEEKELAKNPNKALKEVIAARKEVMALAEKDGSYLYKLSGEEDQFAGENIMGKLSSFKMMKFLIDQNRKNDGNIFRDLASYGLSMGLNPAFFKAIGNKQGKWEDVQRSITKFPKEGTVDMYDSKNNDYDGKIWILDSNKNSGLKLIYWVIFSNYIYNIHILLRSNQPSSKISQATIEITDFRKMKEL